MQKILVLFLLAVITTACDSQQPPPQTEAYDPSRDYFSFANTRDFASRHLELDLLVDFDRERLSGHAVLHMERLNPEAEQIILDTRNLQIQSVSLLLAEQAPMALDYRIGPSDPVMGQPLAIDLPRTAATLDSLRLRIDYHTSPGASALKWLPKELTAGGEHPFMFTQSQSIHARSWIPLQDTPAMRITYAAKIRTPGDLLAVMSADNDPLAKRDGSYSFTMPQPIPSYLLALAVGNLYFEPFGPDTGVYAEPEILKAAAWEFADTQAMLDEAEAIYGPYQWGRYDLLIMPPSFPFGGMENPRLSFITSSVLAGDRSLVSLIAHELAHSWSGNLVSNATWRDIWLNEGTTSYLEARLMEVLYGKERADEERLLGYQSLLELLTTVPSEMQALAPEFASGNPDIGQDGLQYSKGQLLLENLEALFGREAFDAYMANYFDHFAMQAITSEQFLDYIDAKLLQKFPGIYTREQLEQWLYEPDIPTGALVPESDSLARAAALASTWSDGEVLASELPVQQWSPQAMVYFIKALPAELTSTQLDELDEALQLSASRNAEISRAWFIQVASRRYLAAYEAMRLYLRKYGRTRLVEPVYKALIANGVDRDLARSTFTEVSDRYHPMTAAAVERLFNPTPD